MPDVFTLGKGLAAQELSRMAARIAGTYVFPADAGGAVTSNSNMAPSVAAITAYRVRVNDVLDSTGFAGSTVTVATADPALPRRDLIWYDGAGAIGISAGTPATVPYVPVLTAGRIAIYEVVVAAGDTSIDAGDLVDRRGNNDPQVNPRLVASSTTPTSTTSTSAVDLVTKSGLLIPISSWALVRFDWRKQALAAQAVAFGLKVNSTTVIEAVVQAYVPRSTANNRIENGYAEWLIPPRETANYGAYPDRSRAVGYAPASASTEVSGTLLDLAAGTNPNTIGITAALPQAPITSIAIRAINGTTSNAAEITSLQIYEMRA